MSAENNKAIVRRGFEALNQKNLAVFDELLNPDVHFTIEDIIAEEDFIVVRYTTRGTHQGNFMGIPPTGKQVSGTGMFMDRIVNGKAVEQWLNGNTPGLLQQIGVVPAPGQVSQ